MNVPPLPNLTTPNPWENIPEDKRVLSEVDLDKLKALRDKKAKNEAWTPEEQKFYNDRYQGTSASLAPEAEVIDRDLRTQAIHKLRQSLVEFNQARENYAGLEEKKNKKGFAHEYEAAKKLYETKRVEYTKNSIRRFLYEDGRLERTLALGINPDLFKQWIAKQPAGSFQEDLTESLPDGSQKVLGKIFDYDKAVAAYQETQEYLDLHQKHKVWENIKHGYKWLGDQNLEKWTGHQAKTKLGKFLMRIVSARTMIGVGLFGAGVGAATMGAGLTSAGILGFRRLFSGASSALGAHEGSKGLSEHWAKTKGKESQLKNEEIVNLSKDELRLRLQHFELSARENHEDVNRNETYQAIKQQYKEKLETEIKQGKVTDEVIKAEIEELDETFKSVKAKARNKAIRRATLSAAFGVAVGAGLLGKIFSKGVQEVAGRNSAGGLTQVELLQYGQKIDNLSSKFFNKIPNITNWSSEQIKDYTNFLENLNHNFSGVKTSGAFGPEEWRVFMSEHEEMFKGGKVPSAEEISAHLVKDSAITTVAEGQGIETKGIQQILDDPQKFGYTGDLQDLKAIKSFAGKLAHEAALNTQVGDKAVAGVTSGGEAYDLRLKGSALGDKVLLEQGSDGKWHYKFGQGLVKEDLYQHVAEVPKVTPVGIRTETLDWWDKSGQPGTLSDKIDLAGLSGKANGIDVYGFKGDDGSLSVIFTDSATHELLPYSVGAGSGQTADELFKQASEAYQSLSHAVEQVTNAAGEAGKGWSVADKVLAAEWSMSTGVHDKIDTIQHHVLGEVNADKVKDLVDHIGRRAPEFLKDRDFGNYLSDQGTVEHLTPERAGKLWEVGGKIKQAGFKSVDYHFIDKAYSGGFGDTAWNVKGDNFISSIKSPFTNSEIALKIADKSHFNEAFYLENKQLANKIFLNEKIVFNQLGHDFTSEQAKELMAMDVKEFKLSSLAERFGKRSWIFFSNNGTIESWYQNIQPRLGGATSGTVGENLHDYIVGHKGGVSEELAKSKAGALEAVRKAEELEARLRAQDAIEKAEKLLQKK